MSDDPLHAGNEPALSQNTRQTNAPALGGDGAILHLIECLNNPDWQVRMRSTDLLAQIGGDFALDSLAGAILHDRADVRERAARALGSIGTEQSLNTLLRLLDSEQAEAYQYAIIGLGYYRDERVIQCLLPFLSNGDLTLRVRATESLTRIGVEALPSLVALLRNESSTTTSIHTLGVIERFAARTQDEVQKEQLHRVVKPFLRHKDPQVKATANAVLAQLSDQQAIKELAESILLSEDAYWRITRKEIQQLADLGYAALPVILHIYRSLSRRVGFYRSRQARDVLYAMDISILLRGLEDERQGIRLGVLEIIGEHPQAWQAAETLCSLLDHPDRAMHNKTVVVLGQIGHPAVTPALLRAVEPGFTNITRCKAARALSSRCDGRAIVPLLALLGDSNHNNRKAGARALSRLTKQLGRIPGQHQDWAISNLRGALQSENQLVVLHAAYGLAQMHDETAIPYLIDFLYNARSLSYLSHEAIATVLSNLEHPDAQDAAARWQAEE
nr:HEAT repeat domain-containing protein [Anaerolineae bacterium]